MKIGFVGTQGSGKTTALWYVGAYLKNRGVTNFTLVQENARACPYPINREQTFQTANWILLSQILAEAEVLRKWKHVITDRTVFDPMLYFEHSLRHGYEHLHCSSSGHSQFSYIRRVVDLWVTLSPYDYIFLFRTLPLVVDVDRSTDLNFQLFMDRLFVTYFKDYKGEVFEVKEPKRGLRCELVARKIYEELLK